jgi:hypothetical protein
MLNRRGLQVQQILQNHELRIKDAEEKLSKVREQISDIDSSHFSDIEKEGVNTSDMKQQFESVMSEIHELHVGVNIIKQNVLQQEKENVTTRTNMMKLEKKYTELLELHTMFHLEFLKLQQKVEHTSNNNKVTLDITEITEIDISLQSVESIDLDTSLNDKKQNDTDYLNSSKNIDLEKTETVVGSTSKENINTTASNNSNNNGNTKRKQNKANKNEKTNKNKTKNVVAVDMD